MEPRHFIRAAIAVSVVGHLALVVGVYFADARPFDPSTTENIAVDIVTPEQAAEATKEAEKPAPEPEKQPDPFRLPDLTNKPSLSETKPQGAAASKPPASSAAPQSAQQPSQPPQPTQQQQQARQQPAPQQSALLQAAQQQASQQPQQPATPAQPPPSAQPSPPEQPTPQQQAALQQQAVLQQQATLQPPAQPSSPPPAQPEPDITVKYGVMLGLPDGNGGSEAMTKANIAPLDIAAFRKHLKACSKLPPAISRGDKVRVVLRAFLAPNGRLTTEPMLIEAPASAKGPLLMQAAMKALEECQPYAMLPADKYNEWKVLDLPFTPQDFAG